MYEVQFTDNGDVRNYADYFKLAQGTNAVANGTAGKIVNGRSNLAYDEMEVIIIGAKLHRDYMKPYDPAKRRPEYWCRSSDNWMPDADPEPKPGEPYVKYIGNSEEHIQQYGHGCRIYDEDGKVTPLCPFAQWTSTVNPDRSVKRVAPVCQELLTLLFVDDRGAGQISLKGWKGLQHGRDVLKALGQPVSSHWVKLVPVKDGQFYQLQVQIGRALSEDEQAWAEQQLATFGGPFFPKTREEQPVLPVAPAPAPVAQPQPVPAVMPKSPIGQPARRPAPASGARPDMPF